MFINTQAFGITACTMQTLVHYLDLSTIFIDKSNKLGKGKTYKIVSQDPGLLNNNMGFFLIYVHMKSNEFKSVSKCA